MSAHDAFVDRHRWTAHILIAIFCALVATILAAVPGWSAPLHAWTALAACMLAMLAVHAAAWAIARALRRGWRDAAIALSVAAALIASAAVLAELRDGGVLILSVLIADFVFARLRDGKCG